MDPQGFEPRASRLQVEDSSRLSYGPAFNKSDRVQTYKSLFFLPIYLLPKSFWHIHKHTILLTIFVRAPPFIVPNLVRAVFKLRLQFQWCTTFRALAFDVVRFVVRSWIFRTCRFFLTPKWTEKELNLRPSRYQRDALTSELPVLS